MVLPKHIRMNNHAIKQEKDKQQVFGLIYNIKPVKLKILKIFHPDQQFYPFFQIFSRSIHSF